MFSDELSTGMSITIHRRMYSTLNFAETLVAVVEDSLSNVHTTT